MPEMVKPKEKEIVDSLSSSDGFIFTVSHTIQADASVENLLAIVEVLNDKEIIKING